MKTGAYFFQLNVIVTLLPSLWRGSSILFISILYSDIILELGRHLGHYLVQYLHVRRMLRKEDTHKLEVRLRLNAIDSQVLIFFFPPLSLAAYFRGLMQENKAGWICVGRRGKVEIFCEMKKRVPRIRALPLFSFPTNAVIKSIKSMGTCTNGGENNPFREARREISLLHSRWEPGGLCQSPHWLF